MFLKLRLLSLILIVRFARAEMDEYLSESRQQCTTKSNLFACAKYRALRYVSTLGDYYGVTGNVSSSVKLVRLDRYQPGVELFPTARQLSTDSEFTKFFKYLKRQANYYLGTQGVQFSLPDGAQIVDNNEISNEVEEGRGSHKKKKATMVLLPLLILFKLFKIKIMVAAALAALMFIKKAIMLGALVLPSIIQNLKHCAKSQQHHHSAYHFDDHEHDDLGSYYGGGGGYNKDYERAYNAYIKSKVQ